MQFSFCRSKIRFHHFQQTITVSYVVSSKIYCKTKRIAKIIFFIVRLPNPKWHFIFGIQSNNATLHCEVRTFTRHFLIIIYNCLRSNLNLDKVSRKKPHMVICKKNSFYLISSQPSARAHCRFPYHFLELQLPRKGIKKKQGK